MKTLILRARAIGLAQSKGFDLTIRQAAKLQYPNQNT